MCRGGGRNPCFVFPRHHHPAVSPITEPSSMGKARQEVPDTPALSEKELFKEEVNQCLDFFGGKRREGCCGTRVLERGWGEKECPLPACVPLYFNRHFKNPFKSQPPTRLPLPLSGKGWGTHTMPKPTFFGYIKQCIMKGGWGGGRRGKPLLFSTARLNKSEGGREGGT